MWRVNDCLIHGCVFCIGCVDRISESFLSERVFFSIIVFGLVVMDFDLSLPVGDMLL